MRLIIVATLATTLASPALAGDVFSTGNSHGPRAPHSYVEGVYTPEELGLVATDGQAEDGSYPADIIPFDLAVQYNAKEFGNPMGSKGD